MTPRAAVFVLFALAALSDRGSLAVEELKDHYKTLGVARAVTDDEIKVPIDRSRDDYRGAPLSSSSCDDPDRVISFSLSRRCSASVLLVATGRDCAIAPHARGSSPMRARGRRWCQQGRRTITACACVPPPRTLPLGSLIKAAYRKLAKQWHPDKHLAEKKQEAIDRFYAIGEA